MSVLDGIQEKGHENVSFFQDKKVGLTAIIAVHDTTLGPGLGGCRMRDFKSFDDALFDVLRLSEAMTYKNSLAGMNLGGGKSVIIAPGNLREGREELFLRFGKCVQALGGAYYTAEDMNTSVEDMDIIRQTSEYVTGIGEVSGGAGDPSPHTARGVFDGIRACLERAYGNGDYKGRHVAIQGVGHVGRYLAQHLAEAGAKLTITDTKEDRVAAVSELTGAELVAPDRITSVKCDVFSPCAVGGTINPDTVRTLDCKIVAGGANNQLLGDGVERVLVEREILYAPDFAINAGGVISCGDELEPGGYTISRVNERVSRIYHTVGKVLDEAKASGGLPGEIAVQLAKKRIANAASSR